MTNQSQYDELWNNQTKYRKIIEIIKKEGFRLERITPEEVFETLREVSIWEICEGVCEMNDTICDIWEVIKE